MKEPKMIRAQGDGVEIQVAEWPGEGQTVLCVHGLTANCRSFDVIAGAVSPPHRVLAVDLRGRGLSDKPDHGYSIDQHIRDLVAVTRNLGVSRHFLMGHSLGAYIGLAYASAYPDKVQGLVMVDGGADLSPAQWAKVAVGIKPSVERLGREFSSFEAYIELIKKAPFMNPWSEAAETYYRYESEETKGGGRRSRIHPEHIREEQINLTSFHTSEYYPRVKCPVLILRAARPMITDEDYVLPEEVLPSLLAVLPQAKLVNVEGLNHFSIAFQPSAQRDKALLDFLGGK